VTEAVVRAPRIGHPATIAAVAFDTLSLGVVTLGFEMVASRILTPLFGSGIHTWATIISIVIAGLMSGYFAGGYAADRYPNFLLAALIKFASGLYLMLVWLASDWVLDRVFEVVAGEIAALFVSGALVCLPPLLVLGMYWPLSVRLTLRSTRDSGKVSGALFALSSFGNILGILTTTFFLIPTFGSRAITQGFGLFLLASGMFSLVLHACTGRSTGA
jgi:MFS family permease